MTTSIARKHSFPFCLGGMELTDRELCDALEEFERTVVDVDVAIGKPLRQLELMH